MIPKITGPVMNYKHSYKEQIEAIGKLYEKTVQRAFAQACKMSGINLKEPNMKPKHYNPKKVKSKYYTPEGSGITESHYTKFNEHPEDRIYKDREYIQRLQRHIDSIHELLSNDLRLNQMGQDWLFDYVFNEDGKNVEFEEYLAKYNIKYADCVISNKWHHEE
jgi:hypothetical protein